MNKLITGIVVLLLSSISYGQVPWKLIRKNVTYIEAGNDTVSSGSNDFYYSNNSNRYGLLPANPFFRYNPEEEYPHMLIPYPDPMEYDSSIIIGVYRGDTTLPPTKNHEQYFYPNGQLSLRKTYAKDAFVSGWGLYSIDSLFYNNNHDLAKVIRYQPRFSTSQTQTLSITSTIEYTYDTNRNMVQKKRWSGTSQDTFLYEINTVSYNNQGQILTDSSRQKVVVYQSQSTIIDKIIWPYTILHYQYNNATGKLIERIKISQSYTDSNKRDTTEIVRYAYDSSGKKISDSTFLHQKIPNDEYVIYESNNFQYDSAGLISNLIFYENPNLNSDTITDLYYNIDFYYNNLGLLSGTTRHTTSHISGNSTDIVEYVYCHDTAICRPTPSTPGPPLLKPGNTVSVYPNPATGYINLEATFDEETNIDLTISTPDGHIVMRIADKDVTIYKKQISTSGMRRGLYFITVKTKNKKIARRIMVQ
ncbi:MAG: T9SS type A sorting domain-containing protein [Chitinophagaceae bacterium]|nr:T9SS type A sorting domain-containing protein [Chitinophagaceae bacterium]